MMQSRTHTCGQLRIENAGEHVTLVGWMENVRVVGNNFAFLVLRDFYGTTQIVVETEEIMTPEKLFMIQAKVIHELASEHDSCIFVGRCADVVLKDHENCYSFFIHSPVKDRIKRLVETEGVSERQAKKMIKQTDWERSSYHNYYTKQKWGDPGNYDLMINSARTGIEKAAKIIIDYIG